MLRIACQPSRPAAPPAGVGFATGYPPAAPAAALPRCATPATLAPVATLAPAARAAAAWRPGIQIAMAPAPSTAMTTEISEVTCIACTNELLAPASSRPPAGPPICWARAWVAEIDSVAALRAAEGTADRCGGSRLR